MKKQRSEVKGQMVRGLEDWGVQVPSFKLRSEPLNPEPLFLVGHLFFYSILK